MGRMETVMNSGRIAVKMRQRRLQLGERIMKVPQEFFFVAAALVCALIAAVYDVRTRRIPNLLTGSAILVALGGHLVFGGFLQAATAALAGMTAGGVLFIFFIAGGMGAGDVKLMIAIGCFVGLHPLLNLMFVTALSGAAFGLLLAHQSKRLREILSNSFALIHHHLRYGLAQHAELNVANAEMLSMPFALPIAAGCLASLGAQIWSVQ
jgi:prepilin peptidase CpaA